MESMRNRMRGRRLRGLVLHHRRHPSAHPRRLVTRTASWGEPSCPRRLPLVPRAHRRHTPHLARLLPGGLPCRIRTEAPRHPGHDVRGLWRARRGARPQARDQRRPGDGTEGAQKGLHTGEPALALQLLPPSQDQAGPTGSRGSFRTAPWTGEVPRGLGGSTAPGRACSSLLSG